MGRIRQYMLEQGDHLGMARSFGMYQGDPGKATHTRRGTITRGNTRNKRHSTKGTTSARPHKPTGLGGAVSDRVAGALAGLRGGNIGAALGQAILGTGKGGGGGGGGRRRSMNFANVRALKRGLRRVEGFEKLVHRVQKAYPRLKHATHSAPMHQHRFGRKRSK